MIIPASLRQSILQKIHTGHQGIVKCRERARQSVWWPGLSNDLEQLVKDCEPCCKAQRPQFQPLLASNLPKLPRQKVGTDFFEFRQKSYLLIVNYYSQFIEIALLNERLSSITPRASLLGMASQRLSYLTMGHNSALMLSSSLLRTSSSST